MKHYLPHGVNIFQVNALRGESSDVTELHRKMGDKLAELVRLHNEITDKLNCTDRIKRSGNQ